MLLHRAEKTDQHILNRYAPDLVNDRMLRFFDRFGIYLAIALAGLLYFIGGWPWLVWGMFVRTTLCYHSTWFVNSATHLWGYRNYETRDESRNLWWVALASYGEGWHNNHHAHPALARAGHRWWEIDMTFWSIRFLQAFGLAYDVNDGIPARENNVKPTVAPESDHTPTSEDSSPRLLV
jgi:stearoyl-CoA desaturase (delta-9 desaturase)